MLRFSINSPFLSISLSVHLSLTTHFRRFTHIPNISDNKLILNLYVDRFNDEDDHRAINQKVKMIEVITSLRHTNTIFWAHMSHLTNNDHFNLFPFVSLSLALALALAPSWHCMLQYKLYRCRTAFWYATYKSNDKCSLKFTDNNRLYRWWWCRRYKRYIKSKTSHTHKRAPNSTDSAKPLISSLNGIYVRPSQPI